MPSKPATRLQNGSNMEVLGEYIVGFSKQLKKCIDVNNDKALFWFIDGLLA